VVVTALLLAVYWLMPVQDAVDGGWAIRLALGLVLTVALMTWQIRAIRRSSRPLIRAAHALVSSVLTFLLAFAFTYLGISHALPHAFSEPLNKVSALYFTVTTFATVGYGDIVPLTDTARVVVTIQTLLDLAVLATTARLLFHAATGTVNRREARYGRPTGWRRPARR
jgi:voltage-gated potassium channel